MKSNFLEPSEKDVQRAEYEKLIALHEQQFILYEKQFQRQRDEMKRVRELHHNLKSHLITLYGMLQEEDTLRAKGYIRDLLHRDKIQRDEWIVHSGNVVVDSQINERFLQAEREGISFAATVMIPLFLPIKSADLSVILGNLLENAMEACEQMEGKNRYIAVNMKYEKGFLRIYLENSCEGERKKDCSGKFPTTKKGQEHGMGLSIVERALKPYQGSLLTVCGDNVFHAVATLYPPDEKENTAEK